MAGFFSKIRLSSALNTLKSVATWFHNTTVDYSKEKNPLIRMYYDSDLGSPIEQVVEKTYAASAYDTMKDYVPDWKPMKSICRSIGNWIAHKKVQALDVSKVVYHVSTNRISQDKAYTEIAKRTTSGLFVLGKLACKAGHVISWASNKISDVVLPEELSEPIKKGFDLIVGETLRKVRNKVFSEDNKPKVQKFVEKGLRHAYTAAKKTVEVADRVLQKTGEVMDRTVTFVSDVAKKVGEDVKSFSNKVYETAKTIGGAIKSGAEKFINKLKFWK